MYFNVCVTCFSATRAVALLLIQSRDDLDPTKLIFAPLCCQATESLAFPRFRENIACAGSPPIVAPIHYRQYISVHRTNSILLSQPLI